MAPALPGAVGTADHVSAALKGTASRPAPRSNDVDQTGLWDEAGKFRYL
jgi:hypothetical protein